MKKAFTTIELIFVIVIIGILASIAIPKLSATRDDAKVSALARNIVSSAQEIASYVVSKGRVENNLTSMSPIAQSLIRQNKATEYNSSKIDFKMGNVADCISIQTQNSSNGDINLIISYGNASGNNVCQSLQNTIDNGVFPIPISGSRVLR